MGLHLSNELSYLYYTLKLSNRDKLPVFSGIFLVNNFS
ncbi:hypothetical protein SIN_1399 [Streptococcus infantis SK1302]|uniref:Uncharacterized protein n=1 Tax=Streptococcus infantis SK1302 TaxID=871237 RepID=A0ABP2J374_9STRE|nr:hypothetical protein SIN_1399 [Streptococcus infantis SK1302]